MMITRKAESDTLPTWMQTGKSPDQTWWKESSGCNTNFKSSVMIRDGYEGVNRELKKTVVDGETEYMFPKVLTGDRINIDVQTLSDGKGKSDKCQIRMAALNMEYIIKEVIKVLESKPPEEQQQLLADSDKLTEIMLPIMTENPTVVLPLIRTQRINTDSDGLGKSEIFIENEWKAGIMFITCQYGYSASAEASDWAKSAKFILTEIAPLVIDLALAVVTIALGCTIGAAFTVGGSCLAALVLSTALLAAEMAYLYHEYQQTAFGFIDTNKYDCRFPTPGGFQHLYTLEIVDTLEDIIPLVPQDLKTPANEAALQSNAQVQSNLATANSISTGRQMAIIFAMIGATLLIFSGGNSND